MTGKPTDPRIAARALSLMCPRCRVNSGERCTVMSRGVLQQARRIHVERLDMARSALSAESRARIKQAFAS